MKTIDDYIKERNRIQLAAESIDQGEKCWIELGVANRHIIRVVDKLLTLETVENEIEQCFERVLKMDFWAVRR